MSPHASLFRPSAKPRLVLLTFAALATLVTTTHAAGADRVVVYPAPAGLAPAADWQVTVAGQPVFVFDGPVGAIASFDFAGKVDIEVRPTRDVKWVDVRPLSRKVKTTVTNNVIRFSLDRPGNFSVELNREPGRRPLFLFANPIETDVPTASTPGVHFFEAGKVHSPGVIDVKSGETIYIAGGAVVEGSIHGKDIKDVTIRGRGILDGTKFRTFAKGRRTRTLHLQDGQDIRIEGITLSNSQTWQIVPINVDRLDISNVKIVSNNGGDDGIDIVRSRNVTIDGVFIHTKDDCIAVKSAWDYPADVNVDGILVKNSVFWNTEWGNGLEIGFELRSRYVRNIVFRNNDVIHVEDGAVFSIHNGDTSIVENITVEDMRIEDARQKLFDVAIFLTQYSLDRPQDRDERTRRYLHGAWDGVLSTEGELRQQHAPGRGQVKNVVFKDIHIVDGGLPFSIFSGYDADHPIDGVRIENLTMRGRRLNTAEEALFFIEHTKNLRFEAPGKRPRRAANHAANP